MMACCVCDSLDSRPFIRRAPFEIRACQGCGLRFLYPQLDSTSLTELYGESYFANVGADEPGYDRYIEETENQRKTFRERLQLIPKEFDRKRLLDVGAATGVFVEQARLAGWEAEGLEPSQWAADYARETLRQPVRHGTIDSLDLQPATFDVITLWEVIEHVPDPAATLRALHRLLRPNGLLALSTPDAGSLVARLLGRRWPGWKKVPEHLFFFDRATLLSLLNRCGFSVAAHRYVPLTVSRGYLLDRLLAVVGLSRWKRWRGSWLERPIRINPYFDLFVVARRVGSP